jgi:hypothetical protein
MFQFLKPFVRKVASKCPQWYDVTLINDWPSRDSSGNWRARFCIFDLQANTCAGPPSCRAWHAHLLVVLLNVGVELELGWPDKVLGGHDGK